MSCSYKNKLNKSKIVLKSQRRPNTLISMCRSDDENNIYTGNCKSDAENVVPVAVTIDGTWQKWHGFNSLLRVVFIISQISQLM